MSSIYDWSKTSSSNGTADSDINWQEGQPPSTVNNSARQMMARQKEFIDDMGAVTVGGTANAITATLSSAVVSYFDGLRFSFKAASTNTATTTINVNGIGAKTAVVFGTTGEKTLAAGVIKAGCVYDAVYLSALNSSAGGWLLKNVSDFAQSLAYTERNSNYAAGAADSFGVSKFTAAATFSTGVSAATLGSGWRHKVINGSSGDVTIDPNSTELINGAQTLILKPNQIADIFCNGTAFTADVHGDTLSGPQLQGYFTGLAMTTNATDATNDVDIAVGAAASDTSPYYLMQLTSALTKRIDAAWAVGTNQGGLDTGSVTNATYYIWLIQRSDTGVVDALFSLSSTAPTMPASYDRKALVGFLERAAATNGPITWLTTKILGVGQNWRDLTSALSLTTISRQNTTGRPIFVMGTARSTGGTSRDVIIADNSALTTNPVVVGYCPISTEVHNGFSFIVPPGKWYGTVSSVGLAQWAELR